MIEYPMLLRAARRATGLTQAELAERSGVARPNIAAYEAGRREPLFHAGVSLLRVAGSDVSIETPVTWSWNGDRRPYAIPSRLWRLAPDRALRQLESAIHLWWSGPPRTFDLADRQDRLRAYEIVLREGTPDVIESIVDGVLLCEAWPDLVLPPALRAAWARLIPRPLADRAQPAAS